MNFIETCESAFNEIQQLRRDLLAGLISAEAYALQMGGITQGEKHLKLMLAGAIVEKKLRRKLPVDLNKGVLDIRQESHECADRDMIITRNNCLDYSGTEKNHEQCQSCRYYAINRRLVFPKAIK